MGNEPHRLGLGPNDTQPHPHSEEEDAALVRMNKALLWLEGIGICILILSWLSILLVLIGIAFGVPGDLFRAH